MTPPDALTTFLEAMHPTAEGYCELRALPSTARVFVPVGDVDAVTRFLEAHRHENCYTGVATRRTPTTGTLENCAELWTLFVDIDFKQVTEAEARERLSAFPLPPTLVVRSGGGLHGYWQLREPIILPVDAAMAVSLLRRLARYFGGDLASAEPAHILQLPGGRNFKPEYGTPRLVEVESVERHAYNTSELDEWLPPEVPPAKPNGHGDQAAPFSVPPRIHDGARNQVLYRSARSMHAKGWSAAAIRAAVTAENLEKCTPPLPQDEVDAIADHAATQADRPDFSADTQPHVDPTVGLDPAFLADATVVAAEGLQIAAAGVPYLVDGIITTYGTVGNLVAYAKVGKTTFGIALGAAVATGAPFLARTTRQARVLFVAAEDPPEYTAWLSRRLGALPPNVYTFYRRPLLLDDAGLSQIAATVRADCYGLVLIATWQAVVRGLIRDENDNAGAVRIVEAVKACARATGVPWLIDAHSGKGEDQSDDADPSHAMRGASAAAGAADYTLSLRYANGPFGTHRRLSGKGRFVTFPPLVLDYDDTTGSYTALTSDKTALAETTWRQIAETGALSAAPQSVDAIARTAGLVSTADRVTGTHRRQVRAALRNREGIRTTTETRRGKVTTLYSQEAAAE